MTVDSAGAGSGAAGLVLAAAGVAADCPFCCWSGALSSATRALQSYKLNS